MHPVLIIEKDPMTQKLLEIFIGADTKYQLMPSVLAPAEAEQCCADHPVDLILLDMETALEYRDHQIAKQLKEQFPAIKIIMITDKPEYSYIARAREFGADSFWYKKPSGTDLLQIMERTIGGESVYPDSTPIQELGCALSIDFTSRELEVLREVVSGKTDAAIAESLKLSVSTVKFHIQKIREKTGFSTRTELAVRTRESGIVISV